MSKPILLVDDDEAVLHVTGTMLEMLGYEVSAFNNAEHALQAHVPNSFAALISDLKMPGLTGIDLARSVRQREPALPIIWMTGHLALADVPERHSLYVHGVLPKPFRAQQLRAILDTLPGESSPRGQSWG